jgi:hypothetical protein
LVGAIDKAFAAGAIDASKKARYEKINKQDNCVKHDDWGCNKCGLVYPDL